MDVPLDINALSALEGTLKRQVHEDRKYWRVNAVKCDAIYTAKTYEEFSDRVAAAHLRPLEKKDTIKSGTLKRIWNTAVKDETKSDNE